MVIYCYRVPLGYYKFLLFLRPLRSLIMGLLPYFPGIIGIYGKYSTSYVYSVYGFLDDAYSYAFLIAHNIQYAIHIVTFHP